MAVQDIGMKRLSGLSPAVTASGRAASATIPLSLVCDRVASDEIPKGHAFGVVASHGLTVNP